MESDISPRADPSAPAVVLSPHLDDAVWSCFSLLASEDDVLVATVFAGIPDGEPGWWDAQCGIADSAAHVRARRSEDSAVLRSLGRQAVHLDLLDGQYRDPPVPAEEILRAFTGRVPAVRRVYAPGGIGHSDHALVRDAGALLRDRGVPVTVYTDYCYCTREGWPTFVRPDGRPEADDQWEASIGHLVGERLAYPRVVHLTDEESGRKLEAMRGYVTQFANIEAEEPKWQVDGKPSADPEKRAVEVFYDLDTANPGARSGR
jgi:LmbE family N-acetylglucosaminyl deacetylase